MSVLVTRKKAKALRSVERDRSLLTDRAAQDRILDAEPKKDRARLKKVAESRSYLEFRMKNG